MSGGVVFAPAGRVTSYVLAGACPGLGRSLPGLAGPAGGLAGAWRLPGRAPGITPAHDGSRRRRPADNVPDRPAGGTAGATRACFFGGGIVHAPVQVCRSGCRARRSGACRQRASDVRREWCEGVRGRRGGGPERRVDSLRHAGHGHAGHAGDVHRRLQPGRERGRRERHPVRHQPGPARADPDAGRVAGQLQLPHHGRPAQQHRAEDVPPGHRLPGRHVATATLHVVSFPSGGAATGDGTTSTTPRSGLAVAGMALIGAGAVAGGFALRRRGSRQRG